MRRTNHIQRTIKIPGTNQIRRTIGIAGVIAILVSGMLSLQRCKQRYVSPYVSPKTGYLVVEGYISGNTQTAFQLSRTIPLSSDTTSPPEPNAQVEVEGDDNSIYPLAGQGNGLYTSSGNLPLAASVKYRLRVQTQSDGQYLSDYAPYKITVPIDSVNWTQDDEGVNLFVNTHDDAGTTRYYQWNFEETWEYHSAEYSQYEYVKSLDSVILREFANQIFQCWHGNASSRILIASTEKLAKDIVSEQQIEQIPANSIQISVLYSILVNQYALTQEGYHFLSLMQKNTESLGTIFDPQPSQLVGNIRCLTNPAEPVIGYISAGTVQQKRIFINQNQVRNWLYTFNKCPRTDTSLLNKEPYLTDNFASGIWTPLYQDPNLNFVSNYTTCVDCRSLGGTTNKPPYWPY